ncbi:Uncharacterized protein dnl_02450 [Desulfonema limicola]|uniref:DUF6398 domain-containing protein n=1 Tax=Desulfonema limicola TaxID=45656 RepID=A0A975B3C9_9BACT|nr:DUF6398 domain-containing protein [Desulfonema limicola]QTA78037.1 Uncharacterized protein dnl_02450 [Desulfonema limicola]
MTKIVKSEKVPKQMLSIFNSIVKLTDKYCKEYLNDEYALMARYAAAALSRKRSSPLVKGRIKTWACAIVYALGQVNFLFDKSQEIYVSATNLCKGFGVATSTASDKAKTIRDLLKMYKMDPNWCLPSKIDQNPMAWTIMYNGFIIDARNLPREIQEIAYQKGLIPYIP